mmetsp:Transcript_36736/g.84564  ORF Transcript_36736/g.84564 Transcript_36736/m.84564 type:complete len:87 (+) Transcript_36736:969-1229(+)
MLLKKDENATNANNRTRTEKERSVVFVACTSMLAGVNWVNDQCKLVVYQYNLSCSSLFVGVSCSVSQVMSWLNQLPSAMPYQEQAM